MSHYRVLSIGNAKSAVKRKELAARLDDVVARAVEARHIVGAVLLVAEAGEIVYACAAGYADREHAVPMREDTIFRLASVSKVIVSAAAVAAIEQGLMSLRDPVAQWLPDFQPSLPDGRRPLITVWHLLTHTAGLDYGFQPNGSAYREAQISNGLDMPGLSIEEELRRLASVPLICEPGTAWNYSLATDVLGEVLARACGRTLPEAIRSLITDPLGMLDTDFVVRNLARLAVPYVDAIQEPVRMSDPHCILWAGGLIRFSPSRILDPESYASGGAGMAGTARDILALLEAIRRGGRPLMDEKSARIFTTNALPPNVSMSDPGWGFGLGVGTLLDRDRATTLHETGTWRWGGGYGHDWFVNPARALTFVSLTNTTLEGCEGRYPKDLRDAVYRGLPS
jgi:CubicO group peptidase (beta-lactamase class C family)